MICDLFSILFHSNVFQTIISGLLLFILSQFFLEFVLKPRMQLRKLKALLSEKLLTYQAKITNGTLSDEQIKDIRDASSQLLAGAWMIYFRDSKKNQFIDISQKVNCLVSASQTHIKSDIADSVHCLNQLKKYKFLKVTFD
jgi:hypothetical protein